MSTLEEMGFDPSKLYTRLNDPEPQMYGYCSNCGIVPTVDGMLSCRHDIV